MIIEQINNSTGTVTYLHHDQAGSTRLLTGSTGTVTGSTTFDAYGNKTGSTGTSTTPLDYDGQYTSTDTGLIYLRARVYDPATAQFLSSDPLKAITGEPYAYAGDNPLNASDPTGLIFGISGTPSWEEVGEGVAGWGDTITFGATNWVREELGINNVNTCSTAYQAGGYAGLATAVVIPGEGEGELAAEGARIAEGALSEEQAANYARYLAKLPSGAAEPTLTRLPDGSVELSSNVPGQVPGSYARYTKTVNAGGETTGYVKTTYGPHGELISTKDKFNP